MDTTQATAPTTTPAIRVASILFHRVEGRSHECRPEMFTGPDAWKQCETHIMVAARTAPERGGYDKCDVTITFVDGFTYRTRYDMVHPLCSHHETLARHVRGTWEWYAGRDHRTGERLERWERIVANLSINPAEWAALLDTYVIGEVRS